MSGSPDFRSIYYNDPFPTRLRELMKERGTRNIDLANFLLMTSEGVSHYKSGRTQPPVDKIIDIAKFFEVSVDYLLGLSDMPTPYSELGEIFDRPEFGIHAVSIEALNTLRSAIDTYGKAAQTDKAIEEMSELTQALLKYRLAESGAGSRTDALASVRDEMADVEIMLVQLRMIYGSPDSVRRYKIQSLARKMRGGQDDQLRALLNGGAPGENDYGG